MAARRTYISNVNSQVWYEPLAWHGHHAEVRCTLLTHASSTIRWLLCLCVNFPVKVVSLATVVVTSIIIVPFFFFVGTPFLPCVHRKRSGLSAASHRNCETFRSPPPGKTQSAVMCPRVNQHHAPNVVCVGIRRNININNVIELIVIWEHERDNPCHFHPRFPTHQPQVMYPTYHLLPEDQPPGVRSARLGKGTH